jgi:eukaryotic-like serine/threonine-protein kinase
MMEDSLIGRRLANYRLERSLGQGGMAQVYFGWDESLQRPVAVKLLASRYRQDDTYARRFVQEARAIATWRHDHIVQVYYAGAEDGLSYYVMEYIDGLDLSRLLAQQAGQGKRLPDTEVVRIGRAVAAALDYAHARQVIHRDVKPANIMIAGDGRIVLTDFGLALDAHTGTIGETFGSPHYIAPEQARNSAQAVPQSDLYALGVILYEMLTGSPPFDDPSATSLALQHVLLPPPAPRSLNPDLNRATEAVLLRALDKQPQGRYATGQALMDGLAVALGLPAAAAERQKSLVAVAPEAGAAGRGAPAKTGRWVALAGCLLTFTLLLFAAVLWFAWPSAGESEPSALVLAGPAATVETAPGNGGPAPPAETATATVERPLDATAEAPVALPATTAAATDTPLPPASVEPAPAESTSPAEIATSAPAATIAHPGGRLVLLLYDEYSFYIWNAGSERLRISPITFEALDAAGLAAGYWFEGSRWAQFHSFVAANGCSRIEPVRAPSLLRPPRCREYNATVTPPLDSEMVFWRPRPGVSHFRVLWEGQEVARCQVDVQLCEVFLP